MLRIKSWEEICLKHEWFHDCLSWAFTNSRPFIPIKWDLYTHHIQQLYLYCYIICSFPIKTDGAETFFLFFIFFCTWLTTHSTVNIWFPHILICPSFHPTIHAFIYPLTLSTLPPIYSFLVKSIRLLNHSNLPTTYLFQLLLLTQPICPSRSLIPYKCIVTPLLRYITVEPE